MHRYDGLSTVSESKARPWECPFCASLREYVLIDPATRTVEVFTRTGMGAWLFTDQTNSPGLTLTSIDAELSLEWVFKGLDDGGA